jgi:hypothetical protein
VVSESATLVQDNERRSRVFGGRVEEIKEESEEEQERYMGEVRSLCSLLINGAGSLGGKYWLGYLKRKYPAEYNVLETIEMFKEG